MSNISIKNKDEKDTKNKSEPQTMISKSDKMAKLSTMMANMSTEDIELSLRSVNKLEQKAEKSMFSNIPNFNIPNHLLIHGETIIERLENTMKNNLVGFVPEINRKKNSWSYKIQKKNQKIVGIPICKLDEKCAQIDYIPGLNNSLYPHQKVICLAMYMIEQARGFTVKLENNDPATFKNDGKFASQYRLNCSACVLSDSPGSGKTIDLLGLIMLSKIPRLVPNIVQVPYVNNPVHGYIRTRIKKNLLKPTIIFVGRSVLGQWKHQIGIFTENKNSKLKVFEVCNVYHLEKLLRGMISGAIDEYDIVLVKNGNITSEIDFTFDDDLIKSPRSIYNNIARMKNYMWARLIIDDFDTIGLNRSAPVINAIFTWFVSSTTKIHPSRLEENSDKTLCKV
jgi:hypothetical protein